jgi:GNAT superfamily N-acetyltransferase
MYTFKYKELALALYEALIPDPFYIELLRGIPGEQEKQDALMRYMDYSMTEAETYGELILTPYGAAIWSKPLCVDLDNEKSRLKKDFIKTHMGEVALEAYSSIVSFMTDQLGSVPPEAWYLSIAGIAPAYQGKGLGVELLSEVLNQTDKNGLPTYLETFTPRNIKFYEHMGYEIVKKVAEPVTGCDYWIMVREALKTGLM